MALSLRHVADQLFSEVRIAKEKHGHCKYPELDQNGCLQLSRTGASLSDVVLFVFVSVSDELLSA